MKKAWLNNLVNIINEGGDFPGHTVSATVVTKNNGVEYHGVSISPGASNEAGQSIASVLYIDGLEGAFKDGGEPSVVEQLQAIFKKTEEDHGLSEMALARAKTLTDWEAVKADVRIRLVNGPRNIASGKVCSPFVGDITIQFYVRLALEATVPVTGGLLDAWGIALKDLCDSAIENTRSDGYVLESMAEALLGSGMPIPPELVEELKAECHQWIATNPQKYYGAGVIAIPGNCKLFSEKMGGGDFYIIPSSVHECILIPKAKFPVSCDIAGNEVSPAEDLKAMIREVNSTELDPEEILSDKPLYYNASEDIVVQL